MQLEQQETFEIKSPQLEVFGQVESKLPAPAKKRPFAAGFLAVMVLVSVFGIGGVQLKSRYRNVAEIYTSEVDKHGNSIQGDFTTLTDTAANLMRACQKVLGEADSLPPSERAAKAVLAVCRRIPPLPQPRNMRSSTSWITLWTPCTPPPRQKPPTMRWIRSTAWMPAM